LTSTCGPCNTDPDCSDNPYGILCNLIKLLNFLGNLITLGKCGCNSIVFCD
jgi:hypothetical protein